MVNLINRSPLRVERLRPLVLALSLLTAGALCTACQGAGDAPTEAVTAGESVPGASAEAQAAIQGLTQRLSDDPEDAEALAERGKIFYDNAILDRAIVDLQASIRFDSTNHEVWHLLADAQLENMRSRDAINTMIYASSRFADRMQTLLKLAEFQLIVKRYDDALATLERAGRLDKNEPEVFFMLGEVLRESDTTDTARPIDAYERAAELDPRMTDAWLQLGTLHERRGNKIAERYLRTATNVDRDNPLPFRMLADYYSRQGRLPEAVAAYDDAIRLEPQYAEALYNSGLVLLDMDSVQRAQRHFDMAVEVEPGYVDARYYQGVALELQGLTERARQAYQQALNMAPEFAAAREALARLKPSNS